MRHLVLAVLAAVGVGAPVAAAERWVKAGPAAAGLELCVDTASIRRGPDAKTQYRAQFCGVGRVMSLRVECRGSLDGDVALDELRPSGWRTTTAGQGSPMAGGAKFVCSRPQN